MTDLQSKLLEILKWFHSFCEENHIRYYIAEGTVLGAVRHGGFIPWDDDIDVTVPREDYERLMSIFGEQRDHYRLESMHGEAKDYLYSYAKLYDTETTMVERMRVECKRGIYLDIFPLDGMGETEEEAKGKLKRFERMNNFLLAKTCPIRKGRAWYKNAAVRLMRLIPSFLVSDKKLARKVDALAASFGNADSAFVANLMGVYGEKEIMPREVYGEGALLSFENITVRAPQMYEEYLVRLYRNWQQMPPEEKRVSLHQYTVLDLEKSYLDET